MVTGSIIPSGLAAPCKVTDLDRGFAIQAQAFGATACLSVMSVDVLKDGVCFWNFF